MISKRKRRRWGRAAAFSLVLLALLAGCGALWFFWPRSADRNTPSATPPASTLTGLRLSSAYPTAAGSMASSSREQLEVLFEEAALFAAQHRMNAIFLDAAAPDGSTYAFRDRALATWAGAAGEDSLLRHYDPLASLCERASASGLAVYLVVPSQKGDTRWEEAMSRVWEKYPLAGICTDSGALLDTVSQNTFFEAGADAFADPFLLFAAATADGFAGAVFDYAQCRTQPENFSVLCSALDTSAARPGLLQYTPRAALSIAYPAAGATIYTKTCFLMGTSDPSQPLLLNGTPVETRAPGGTFGVLVDVAEGENTFTFTQGDTCAAVCVARPAAGGGTGAGGALPHDATTEMAPGTPVRMNGWITSLLYDPSSDGNISETVRRGAVARITQCAETVRNGKKTWAYQLASGDYVLACNVEALPGDMPRAAFSGAVAAQTDTGEILTFTGSGTPLAYTNVVDGALVMDFYDADLAADFLVTGSSMVASVTTEQLVGCVRATFTFTQPLWGHTVEYADGTTRVLLKKAPVRSDVFAKPLSGVRVLLDAGHGDSSPGAMGAAGQDAPQEQDVNLALALAAQYRLEQLGAAVQMIRTDGAFLSLEERNQAITTNQPDFFISIHHNSVDLSVDANGHAGTECYYFYDAGKALAQTLVSNITAATGRADRGAQWGYYYVTRSTVCPAVLLEAGFMVNPAEYEDVTNDATIWKTADAIARSVLACVPAGE